jgi:hypothetical protein
MVGADSLSVVLSKRGIMRQVAVKVVLASAGFLAVATGVTGTARADLATYTIDPLQSSLTLAGTLTGSTAIQQTPGSTSTSYSGSIIADRVGNTIKFPGGSALVAASQAASQQPRNDGTPGSQPADYGRRTDEGGGPFGQTAFEALRDVEFDLFDDTSGLGATVAPNGNFASNSFGLEFNSGESDTIYGLGGNPDNDLTNKGTANSTGGGQSSVVFNPSTGIETLTLRLSTGNIGYSVNTTGDSTMSFTGTIVATRLVPEPGAIGVLAVAATSLLARRRRRA